MHEVINEKPIKIYRGRLHFSDAYSDGYFEIDGEFSETVLDEVKRNVGRDYIFSYGKYTTNLKFTNLVVFQNMKEVLS